MFTATSPAGSFCYRIKLLHVAFLSLSFQWKYEEKNIYINNNKKKSILSLCMFWCLRHILRFCTQWQVFMYKDCGYGCQQTVTYFFSSSKFCFILCRGRQFICHGFQRSSSLCPPPPHYTDSSLISHEGNQPPHEFGHCSPMGPGQASFYNSANDAEIFFSVIIW